jgi:hypothetical protein
MEELDWNPISNAPKDGTIIYLRDEGRIYICAMYWDKKRKLWTGVQYGMVGAVRTYWDESVCKIHEWRYL